jgi:hypothetical protein
MKEENEGLILPETPVATAPVPYLAVFILAQLIPLLLFLLSALFDFISSFVLALVNLVIAIPNFIGCQRILGRNLVGLSWRFDPAGSTGWFWSHEIEPDPFVPTKLNSNCFWIGIGVSAVTWVGITLHYASSISDHGFFSLAVSLVITILYILNLIIFFKVQQLSSQQSVDAVRIVLLGHNSAFPDADEISDSDDEPNREKVKEEPVKEPEVELDVADAGDEEIV